VQGAIIEAAKTVRNMSWFEVIETRGAIKDGKVDQWQVTVKVGFRIES
jgi:flavin-binding protein dodecin